MFKTVFSFGDSLSDAGNDYIIDGRTDPVTPYYDGHFSNGRTWVEDLSQKLGLGTLTPSLAGGHDFAFGGAETGPTAIEGANPGDLLGQVAQYGLISAVQGALYTLDIGGNDIIKALDEFRAGKITISERRHGRRSGRGQHGPRRQDALRARRAQPLVLRGAGSGASPHLRAEGAAWQNLASGLAQSFDQTVLSDLVPLERLGLKVYDLPTYADLDLVVNDPSYFRSQYGITFTNVTDPGWTGNFTDPSSGTWLQATKTICSLTRSIRPRWRIVSRPTSPTIPWPPPTRSRLRYDGRRRRGEPAQVHCHHFGRRALHGPQGLADGLGIG